MKTLKEALFSRKNLKNKEESIKLNDTYYETIYMTVDVVDMKTISFKLWDDTQDYIVEVFISKSDIKSILDVINERIDECEAYDCINHKNSLCVYLTLGTEIAFTFSSCSGSCVEEGHINISFDDAELLEAFLVNKMKLKY